MGLLFRLDHFFNFFRYFTFQAVCQWIDDPLTNDISDCLNGDGYFLNHNMLIVYFRRIHSKG